MGHANNKTFFFINLSFCFTTRREPNIPTQISEVENRYILDLAKKEQN